MSGRPQLSDDDEREDREDRARLREVDAQIHKLRARRQGLLDDVHRLSDEQRALYDRKQPLQSELDQIHADHRDLGRQIAELRPQRDAARRKADNALAAVRMARPVGGREDRVGPDQIRQEIARLELRQQTTALSVADENILIDYIRQLGRKLKEVEASQAVVKAEAEKGRALEEELRRARAEVDAVQTRSVQLGAQRDGAMQAMRSHLMLIGQLMGQMREKAHQRGQAMAEVDELSRRLHDLERDAQQLINSSRARRQEARRTISQYSTGRRPSQPTMVEASADAHLEELLKRGRVTLGG